MLFDYDNMPGAYKDILMLAARLHNKMIPHELSMTYDNGWCIEVYPIGMTPYDERKFILIQDDRSFKNNSRDIEFTEKTNDGYITEKLDEDECFERIEQWWKDESRTNYA